MRLCVFLLLSSLLSACSDPCSGISTCEGCVAFYISDGCRWCPADQACGDYDAPLSCAFTDLVFDSEQCLETAGGADTGSCTETYQGPTGDPQVSTQCQAVWHYRCVEGNASNADQNCLVYDSLDATVSCPYCSGGGGGEGEGEGEIPPNTCNGGGIAEGCTGEYPFSCSSSQSCYTTLASCANDASCQL